MIYDLTQELNRSPVKVIPYRAKKVTQTLIAFPSFAKVSPSRLDNLENKTIFLNN
jgi:hypothetical protein